MSLRVFLDEEVRDTELVSDQHESRLSSDDNLPWPIESPTRPAGVSFAGVGKIAHSVSCILGLVSHSQCSYSHASSCCFFQSYTSPSWTNVVVHIEKENLVYARWTDLRNTLIMKRFL